jgi:ribonuclease-3
LANTYESLLGAIFFDNGLSSATNFVNKSLIPNLKEIIKNKLYKDFKSQLQEISQAKFNVTPSYKLISTKGPDHTKIFETGAYLDKKLLAKGAGKSKQTSEQEAARVALEKIVKTK